MQSQHDFFDTAKGQQQPKDSLDPHSGNCSGTPTVEILGSTPTVEILVDESL
jgi:hypothetical protein